MKKIIILLLIFVFIAPFLTGNVLKEKIRGVKIYKYDGDLHKLFKEFKSLGINTVLVGEELAKNKSFYTIAKKIGIKTFIVFPVFCNLDQAFKNKSLYALDGYGNIAKDEWLHFACPVNVKYRKDKIDELKKIISTYNPDGISIDFIRYFVYWEKIFKNTKLDPLRNTCFCDKCLSSYEKASGFKIPSNLKKREDKAKWILKNHKKDWVNRKIDIISSMVRDISKTAKLLKPDIMLNAHIIPWREKDYDNGIKLIAGQDIKKLSKYVDYISPMCYWHMLKRNPEWISSVVNDMSKLTDKPIIPSIQVNTEYLKQPITYDTLRKSYKETLKKNSSGVIFWKWGFFAEQPLKKKVFKE